MAARFEGDVVVKWVTQSGSDRDMKLVEKFAFVDDLGKKWKVKKNAVINGASIPRLFWTSVGPPFVGDYRRASVVHDYYCQVKTEPWREVHRMFKDACIAGGVGNLKAKTMFGIVYAFGPKWPAPGTLMLDTFGPVLGQAKSVVDEYDFDEIQHWIGTDDPDIGEIENRIDGLSRIVDLPLS